MEQDFENELLELCAAQQEQVAVLIEVTQTLIKRVEVLEGKGVPYWSDKNTDND